MSSVTEENEVKIITKFLFSEKFLINCLIIILLSILIFFFYYYCDYQRKISFNENFETALDDMARFEARTRINEKQEVKPKNESKV
jgi:predicted membrane protein